jgi:hypothetical protein
MTIDDCRQYIESKGYTVRSNRSTMFAVRSSMRWRVVAIKKWKTGRKIGIEKHRASALHTTIGGAWRAVAAAVVAMEGDRGIIEAHNQKTKKEQA